MKKILLSLATSLLLISPAFAEIDICLVESHFTPVEEMTPVVKTYLGLAKSSVKVAVFGLTNDELADTLIQLHNAGVKVEVAVDKLQSSVRGTDIPKLVEAGIPVYVKKTSYLNHNKYVIIDDQLVLMGSWNWSVNAETQDNSEVILYGCRDVIGSFINDFSRIKERDQ